MYELRPRQKEAVEKIDAFINDPKKNHGVFVYCTGFGKSLIISSLASKYPNKYFINVTVGKELLKQNYEKYTSYGFEADICSASLGEKNVGRVTFATIGTLAKQVNFFKNKEVILVQDEAHESSKKGSVLDNFVKQLTNYKLVGLTATPFRLSNTIEGATLKMMNRDRDCIYKSIEDVVQIQEVVESNYWAKLIYDIKDVDTTELELNTSGTEYKDESIIKFNESNDITNRIIEEIEKLIEEGRKSILVSVPFIQDAKNLEAKFKSCKALYSGMPPKERDSIVDDFKSLKLKVVVQCKILTIGFDHPQLDAIISARPSNSLVFVYQLLGRGVRKHDLKKDCKIVDFSGNVEKFGRVEDLVIENSPLTKGWAVFSGENLLTNYPLNTKKRPTKKSLQSKLDWEKRKQEGNVSEVTFHFGKFKNKTVNQVMKENKSYLTWLLDQKDFNWFGEKGKILKERIEQELGVFVKKPEPISTNAFFQNYTQNIRSIKDLKNIW